jgi:hypothetical protein
MRCCETCKYAVYDSVPYGMGSCSYLSDCKRFDDMTEDEYDKACDTGGTICDFYDEVEASPQIVSKKESIISEVNELLTTIKQEMESDDYEYEEVSC